MSAAIVVMPPTSSGDDTDAAIEDAKRRHPAAWSKQHDEPKDRRP